MKNAKWEYKSSFGFILVFVMVTILILCLGFIYKKNEEQVWKRQAISELQKVADFKTHLVEVWKTDVYTESKELAESPLLQKAISDWLINRGKKQYKSLKERFQIVLNNRCEHSNIFLVGLNSELLISMNDSTRFLAIDKSIINTKINSQNRVFSDFYKNKQNGRIFLDIAFPVLDQQKKVQAFLIFQIDPAINLFSTISKWPYDSKSEEFILFEKAGDSVLFINKLKHVPNPVLSFSLPLSQTGNPAVKAALYGPGTYEGVGYNDQKVIEVIQKVNDSPWFFAAKINRDELFAPVYGRLRVVTETIIGVFLLFSLSLFLIVFYRRRHFYKTLLEKEREKNALKYHYDYVIKYANDIILLEDEELNIVDANQRALQAYQYTLDELQNMKKTDLIAPCERNASKNRIKNLDVTDGYICESIHQRKDGSLFDVEISARVITIDEKKYFHQVIRDITERKHNEKALMESEERFRTTLYSTGDAIITTDIKGKIQNLNKVAERLTGWMEKEAKGRHVNEVFRVFSEETSEKLESPVDKALRQGIIAFLSNHTYLIHRNGEQIPIYDSGAPIRDTGGEITGAVLVFRDQREERKIRKALENSELHYHSLTDHAPVGIFRTRSNGYTTYVNPTLCQLSGIEAKQALGDGWLAAVHTEDRKKIASGWQDSIKNQKAFNREFRFVQPEGKIVYVIGHAVPEICQNGEITGYVGTITDITEQKEVERKLFLFRTLIDRSNDSIEIIDSESGRFLDVNRKGCEDLGYTREEMLKLTVFDIDPKVNKAAFSKIKEEILRTGNRIWEGIHKRKDGSTYPVEVNIHIVKLDHDYMFSIARDITAHKQMLTELQDAVAKAQESDRLKSAFLMNMSHEIRTPMNGIMGFMDLLGKPNLSDKDKLRYLEVINKSGERLMNTINDIVEISKIEIGDISLDYEDVFIVELMQYYYDFFKIQAHEKGLSLSITKQITGSTALVKTDKYKLDSILMNLVKNAIKFTDKGRIELGNYLKNGDLYFYVTDTGRGIPKDKLGTIFDRFVQVDVGLKRDFEGSGIGLSIVKAYIEALNGHIEVKSEIGKGSTFLFSIPYQPLNTKSKIPEEKYSDQTPLTKSKILIAEDDQVSYILLEVILSKEFDLLHGRNGEETVKLFMNNPDISLVLMDIKMPGKFDGLEATRKIRQLNQEVPIIAITAYIMEIDRIRAQDAGCNDYITKPFRDIDLLSLLKKYYIKD